MPLTIDHIILTQFRNYDSARFEFTERVVGFCGRNGVGKTNLLDAIHYLCFTKSYFSRTDSSSVGFGSQGFRIEGGFSRNNMHLRVACILRENGKKEIWNGEECYDKFSMHIGQLPVVMVIPDDISLITGSSSDRRKFLDTLLAQLNPDYLQSLIRYNKILQQRNSWLKQAAAGPSDRQVLEILDRQLQEPGDLIFRVRRTFLDDFIARVQLLYTYIAAGSSEIPQMSYQSQLLAKGFPELLSDHFQKDLILQRSNAGVHKDDLELGLDGQPFKTIASQGQQKSLLFALKLAEFEVLRESKGFPPLLLLDDIFEKLDEERMQHLLKRVCIENDGQVFITDTHCGRIKEVLAGLGTQVQLVELG